MHYLSVEGLSKSYGVKTLFENISFHISQGDKVALVAKNGSGKSSLLQIIAGRDTGEAGSVWVHKDVQVAFLDQRPVLDERATVLDHIFSHNHPTLQLIRRYERALTEDGAAIADLAAKMDTANAWQFEAGVKEILGKLGITFLQQQIATLSGGQKKRVALAKVLIDIGFDHQHTLLILDEPTNHLDVEMIEWLEQYLSVAKMTLLLVTHDRYFLDQVCNQILELDNGRLFVHNGHYARFLENKQHRLEQESASREKAKNLYRKELDWMRRQPRARGTKAKSRIDAFYEVKEKALRKASDSQLSLEVKMTRLGGKILELKKVRKAYGGKMILGGFDYTFQKGERVGIIGKNGVGKSTFLNIIQGIEKPDSGKVNIGDTVTFGYYHQKGLRLKDEERVIDWVKNIAENFPLADGGVVSASEFLTRFLFPPEQQYTYISRLSGGEKKRLQLLSVLFRNPNFLILDEPTNDLDVETLQVLEDFLEHFPGCVVVVSHDRYFMDRLIDHLFVFEGGGEIRDFPGNYSQYREAAAREEEAVKEQKRQEQSPKSRKEAQPNSSPEKKKLSYNEQRELKQLGREIPKLEEEKTTLTQKLSDTGLPFEELQAASERIAAITTQLDEMEMRWLELEERK